MTGIYLEVKSFSYIHIYENTKQQQPQQLHHTATDNEKLPPCILICKSPFLFCTEFFLLLPKNYMNRKANAKQKQLALPTMFKLQKYMHATYLGCTHEWKICCFKIFERKHVCINFLF